MQRALDHQNAILAQEATTMPHHSTNALLAYLRSTSPDLAVPPAMYHASHVPALPGPTASAARHPPTTPQLSTNASHAHPINISPAQVVLPATQSVSPAMDPLPPTAPVVLPVLTMLQL